MRRIVSYRKVSANQEYAYKNERVQEVYLETLIYFG